MAGFPPGPIWVRNSDPYRAHDPDDVPRERHGSEFRARAARAGSEALGARARTGSEALQKILPCKNPCQTSYDFMVGTSLLLCYLLEQKYCIVLMQTDLFDAKQIDRTSHLRDRYLSQPLLANHNALKAYTSTNDNAHNHESGPVPADEVPAPSGLDR